MPTSHSSKKPNSKIIKSGGAVPIPFTSDDGPDISIFREWDEKTAAAHEHLVKIVGRMIFWGLSVFGTVVLIILVVRKLLG